MANFTSKRAEAQVQKMLHWMTERQKIYERRKAGEKPPWTTDQVLAEYKFCNVYREQDRVTCWIRENWRQPYANHRNLWFAMAIARQINWPPTLEEIGFPKTWDPIKVLKIMRRRADTDQQNYSGAYMLTAGSGSKGVDKPFITVEKILNPLYERRSEALRILNHPNRSLASFSYWLRSNFGFGPFLSYEVTTDLRHTRYLCNAHDIYTWANAGPGARRGLNRILGRALKQRSPEKQLLEEMIELMDILQKRYEVQGVLLPLELRDIEHSLCEFDKYCRAWESIKNGRRIGLDKFNPTRTRILS